MKKLSILLSFVLVVSLAFGQTILDKKSTSIPVLGNKVKAAKDLIVIWENDFSNPSEWSMEYSQNNPNDGPWVIGTNGPSGYYSTGMGPIHSTTADNGSLSKNPIYFHKNIKN